MVTSSKHQIGKSTKSPRACHFCKVKSQSVDAFTRRRIRWGAESFNGDTFTHTPISKLCLRCNDAKFALYKNFAINYVLEDSLMMGQVWAERERIVRREYTEFSQKKAQEEAEKQQKRITVLVSDYPGVPLMNSTGFSEEVQIQKETETMLQTPQERPQAELAQAVAAEAV